MDQITHCHFCGGLLDRRVIEGRLRLYCQACSRPIYENPLPATCMVVINGTDQVLLVKRKVDPRKGQWCLPGGWLPETMPRKCAGLHWETSRPSLLTAIGALWSNICVIFAKSPRDRIVTRRLICNGDRPAGNCWASRIERPPFCSRTRIPSPGCARMRRQ